MQETRSNIAIFAPLGALEGGRLEGFFEAFGVGSEDEGDFVSDFSENDELLFFGSFCQCGVFKAPVVAMNLTGKERAGFARVAADCNDGVDACFEKGVPLFGRMRGKIDVDFGHYFDGEGVNGAGGVRTRAGDFSKGSEFFSENAFSHVTAAGVSGAKNEDVAAGFFG